MPERLTQCQRGHPMTEENRYHPPSRPHKSMCLACHRLRSASRPKRQPKPCRDCGASVGPATGLRPATRCPDCQRKHKLEHGREAMRRYRAEGRMAPVKRHERVWDEDARAAFWGQVAKGAGCWEWTGTRSNGYGHVYYVGWSMGAHRASWEMTHGPIPDGLVVRHRCDNPPCVRPDHLELGTHADNAHDTKERRRHQYGDRHWTNRTRRERDEHGRWKAA